MTSTAIESLRRLVPIRDRIAHLLRSAPGKALLGAHVIVAVIILARSYGWLQPLELLIYDALCVAWAGHEPSTRIFLVGGTEDDVADFDWPLRDGDLADLLERLASWNPRVIGVDIYRDKPKPPGTERLAEVLARHKEIVWSFKLQEGAKRAILPPEALRGTERAVLADFIPDSGNMIRRALLYAGDEHEAALRLSTGRSAVKGEAAVRRTHHPFVLMTRFGHLVRQRAHQGGSISPLMIFTTCDASANSVAAIAKVTLTRLSLAA